MTTYVPKRLSIERCEPGMEVAEDVADRSGRLLIRKGGILTDKSIRVFKSWGVSAITILVEEQEAPDNTEPTQVADELSRNATAELFQHCDRAHPAIKALELLIARRIASGKQPLGD